MRLLSFAFVSAFLAGFALAQSPTPPGPQANDKSKTDKPAKLPPSPLDKVEGYQRHLIEGFTVMVSTEAGEGVVKDAELKPMDVLALEFATLKKVLLPKQVEALQKVPVWVEWDEYQTLSNGRVGRALAVYYGGSQLGLLKDKKNPFKSKCVTVLSLKLLTEMHQPKRENNSLVVLHEYAHAVHDQLLGFDHAGIKAAYKQALERKLYDKAQYVSTNEAEFFAEVTCAYYDQLNYYPKTRDDLKKHDPATHQLLESIWGTARKPVKTALPKTLAESNGADKFDLKLALKDVRLGTVLVGPSFKADDAKDTVVILSCFGGAELLVLDKLAKMHQELSPYGARVVVSYSFVAEPEAVKKKLQERNVAFTGFDKALFAQKDGTARAEKPGHTVVFDAGGQCVFRGSGYEALPHARAAVARMILAKTIPTEIPKALAPVTGSLALGSQPILDHLPKLAPLALSDDTEVAAAAKALVATILAPAQTLLAEAQNLAKADPYSAYLIVEKITTTYKGTSASGKAAALAEQWKLHPTVAAELKARTMLEPIRKLDTTLGAQPGGFSPLDDKFQKANAVAIQQLLALHAQLKKKHPMARSTEEAGKIAAKYHLGD